MTYLADHVNGLSHDAVNRFLRNDKLTARLIWEHVQGDIVPSAHGCLVFDDSILDKGHSHCIEMVKLQYSGNAHGLIKGIGMVNCLYVNPETQQYWIVDYRIYDPGNDGKSKLDHVRALLHKSKTRRPSPYPGRTYATGTVTGRPSCVKRLSSATRTCSSTTWRSNVRAITRSPSRLKQCILVSTRLRRW